MKMQRLLTCALAWLTVAGCYAQGPGGGRGPGDPNRPPRQGEGQGQGARPPGGGNRQQDQYSLEQAISDNAQLHTIAFDGLAFLTGEIGANTFLPPGKVCDYFGFQYLRDIEPRGGGHNTSFLTRIAVNMLRTLTPAQTAELIALAKEQVPGFREFAVQRFALIKAFHRQLTADLPTGSTGLSKAAVQRYSADLWALDGRLAYRRAEVMGRICSAFTVEQKASLAKLKFGDSSTWPDLPETFDKRSVSHEVMVALMTYVSEMYSWYAGHVEADVYFCPERHATYFGSFYMKDRPVMGKHGAAISTSVTGDSGAEFLSALLPEQRQHVTSLIELQRADLNEVVTTRRAISVELRKFLAGGTAEAKLVEQLSRRYGELDGAMSYNLAMAFAAVNRTLTAEQRATLVKLRNLADYPCAGAYLYSTPIALPDWGNTDALFAAAQ
ncbi:MAG: hypothetical protein IT204_10165 [Fimbriimonadaceae bacterium]|nr:hypothetical protein [Fimbriimonadaceae bacterium]